MKNKLTCRLKNCVLTNEGDFVPSGTPVEVFGWGDYDNPRTRDKIECRAAAYVYAASWECKETHGSDRASVNGGLWLSVDPENLVYEESR
jgi:hypothetical protein